MWVRIGVGALLALLLCWVILWPAWFKRLEIRKRITTLRSQITTTKGLIQRKAELLRDKEACSAKIQAVKSKIYAPGESSLLLGEVSKLAQETHVAIIASKPQSANLKFPPPYSDQYDTSLYEFVVEGGYHELGQFMSRVESNPKLLSVRMFHLTSHGETPKTHTAEIALMALTFKKAKV